MLLRLTDISLPLPLNGSPELSDLRCAACARLQITDDALLSLEIYRRAYDARKRSAINLIYTLLVQVADPEAVLAKKIPHVSIAPDTSYQFVLPRQSIDEVRVNTTKALPHRPVIIGFGPCGLFAALILAQMGLRPIILERG